jgi:cysteine synthase A
MTTSGTVWRRDAEERLLQERERSAATPLRELALPALPGRRLIFKDESAHPTGSLKHRLARALLLQGVRNGAIGANTPLFDASSGNTAVSEAWFARLLGLRYFAVIPATTSPGKQALIRAFGGECVMVKAGACCKQEAARLAHERDGYFLDQFTNAALAVDWRAHNVVAELFAQLRDAGLPQPDWFVTGAGTGGTASCAGRHFRHANLRSRLLVVDPEDSAFHGHYAHGLQGGCICASRVEGIGRPTVEPSFMPDVVDRMLVVPDAASHTAARWLSLKLEQNVGVSTGTNLIGAIHLFDSGHLNVATLICDDGARYAGRLDDDAWLAAQGFDTPAWMRALDAWHRNGEWLPPVQPCGSFSRTLA